MTGNIEKQDLLDSLNAAAVRLNPEFTGLAAEVIKLIKKTKDLGLLSKSFLLKDLKFKSDVDVVEAMSKTAKNISSTIPDLVNVISDVYPDKIPANSINPNIRIGLGISDTIISFSDSGFDILNYLLDRYANVNIKYNKEITNNIKIIARVLKQYNKDYLSTVITTIGKLPVAKNREGTPNSILTSALSKNLNIKDSKVLRGISDINDRFLKKGFTGNPIYHIRKFIVDLEVNKLARLKDNKRLIELKLQKLKLEQANKPKDNSLQHQIDFYQKKLDKTELLIDTIMDS